MAWVEVSRLNPPSPVLPQGWSSYTSGPQVNIEGTPAWMKRSHRILGSHLRICSDIDRQVRGQQLVTPSRLWMCCQMSSRLFLRASLAELTKEASSALYATGGRTRHH